MAREEAAARAPGHVVSLPRRRRDRGYVFVVPAVLVIVLVLAYPIAYSVRMSFWAYLYGRPVGWVGLQNWEQALHDTFFWESLGRTIAYSVVAIPAELVLAFLIALFVHHRLRRYTGLLRTLVLIPFFVQPVVIGVMWRLVLVPGFGLLDGIMARLGLGQPDILGTYSGAFWSVVVMDLWMWTPFVFLILLAALEALPADVMEAALVDGATGVQRLARITLPLIRPAIGVALVLRTIDAMRIFDQVYSLTKGGPGTATTFVSIQLEQTAFGDLNFGSASAELLIMFVIMLALSYVYFRLFIRRGRHAA